jgi:hypothetical protein
MVIKVNFIKMKMFHCADMESIHLSGLIRPVVNTETVHVHPHKAIVWGREELLAQAVSSFLKNMHWEVIRVLNTGGVEELVRETKRINPEVVIVCREKDENLVLTLNMVDELPNLKVIMLGLDNNLMQVYSKQNVILQDASELMSIIDDGNYPACTRAKEVKAAK